MVYFYDYFAKQYREGRKGGLIQGTAAMSGDISPEDVESCRVALRKSFAGYRSGRNAEELKRLTGEYRGYAACSQDGHAKDRYNAFAYRYMVGSHASGRATATRLGVAKGTAAGYVGRCIDEILVLCMGIPAAAPPGDRESAVRMLVQGSRLFDSMAGDYVLCLFSGKREREAVEIGRKLTKDIMEQFKDAVMAYSGYCNDEHTHIDTDIRKAEVLEKCLAGVPPAAIAEEHGCCESTVYADIRENERRLAAMLFGEGSGAMPASGRSSNDNWIRF